MGGLNDDSEDSDDSDGTDEGPGPGHKNSKNLASLQKDSLTKRQEKEALKVALPPVKDKAVLPDKVLRGPQNLRYEEFGDDQLKQMLEMLDHEVETELEGIKTKYTKLKQQIMEKVKNTETNAAK